MAVAGDIARGQLTMFAGMPSVGKGVLLARIAETITNAGTWPDGSPCRRGDVFYMAAEDARKTTLIPRWRAAGADMLRVGTMDAHLLGPKQGTWKKAHYNLAEHLPLIEAVCRARPELALLVIDPINSFVAGGRITGNNDGEVRAVLDPLKEMAERLNIAVIGVSHFGKNDGRAAVSRVLGSTAFTAVPRNVHAIIQPAPGTTEFEDDSDVRILSPVKTNTGRLGQGFAYHIDGKALFTNQRHKDEGLSEREITRVWGSLQRFEAEVRAMREETTGFAEWGGRVNRTADELLAPALPGRLTERERASIWIMGNITRKWVKGSTLKHRAEEAGFSAHTFERARAELREEGRIEKKQRGTANGLVWMWRRTLNAD